MTDRERFLSKVEPLVWSDCHIWTGVTGARGYGSFNVGGRITRAHRYAYELEHGPIALGLVVDHVCGVKLCVNPSHLRAVLPRENIQYRTGVNKNNTSGFRGVYFCKQTKSWAAGVKVNRKKRSKRFPTAEEANAWAVEIRRSTYRLGEFGDSITDTREMEIKNG